MLNYSEACSRNQDPILQILRQYLHNRHRVLEIGSGSGQHALHFTRHLPELYWQPSELPENLPALQSNLQSYGNSRIAPALSLDVRQPPRDLPQYDVVYTANTLHIMSWPAVIELIAMVADTLPASGLLIVYGPFKYQQAYTSRSNAQFDLWLQARDPASGIRNIEELQAVAATNNIQLLDDHAMPANNQCLIWQKQNSA